MSQDGSPCPEGLLILREQEDRYPERHATLALLIDADNISADLIPSVLWQVQQWGKISIRRIYGNLETLRSQKWRDACLHAALQPVVHLGIRGAKNATDISLTVDAMDLLYQRHISVFCLVIGDQDFTALVLRLRSQGCQVFCIGKSTRSAALATVCMGFLDSATLPSLVPDGFHDQLPSIAARRNLLIQAVRQLVQAQHTPWIPLVALGAMLRRLDPQFFPTQQALRT